MQFNFKVNENYEWFYKFVKLKCSNVSKIDKSLGHICTYTIRELSFFSYTGVWNTLRKFYVSFTRTTKKYKNIIEFETSNVNNNISIKIRVKF